jgi:FkbM family methyltransferase
MRIERFYGHSIMIDGLDASSTVLDLGSNHGHFALAMVDRFDCKAFCVEPDPRIYPTLDANPRLSAINAAITTKSGSTRLYLGENWECSSVIPLRSCKTLDEIECRALTLEDVLKTIGVERVDVLKIDIEGLEIDLLKSFDDQVLEHINQIAVEFHEWMGISSVKQVFAAMDHLKSHGFGVVHGSFFDYSDVLFLHEKRLTLPRHWRWLAGAEKIRNGVSRRLRTVAGGKRA